jgi:hypothetical protein
MAKEEQKQDLATFDSKAMLADQMKVKNTITNADGSTQEVGAIIKYADRKRVEIVKATKHYHVGQVINPHKIMGEALIKQGIAKEAKEKK